MPLISNGVRASASAVGGWRRIDVSDSAVREVDAHGDGRGAGEARGELTVALAAHGHGEIADAAIPERQASTRHIDVHARLADAFLEALIPFLEA